MKAGPLIIIGGFAITLALYILSKPVPAAIFRAPLLSISQITALGGTLLLSYSFILSSRLPGLERLFGGLDRVYQAHHVVAGLAFVLILEHPLFLVINKLPDVKGALIYLLPSFARLDYTMGILATCVMVILMIFTLYIHLPYHIWKKSHEFMGLSLLLGSIHVMLISSDVSRFLPLRIWILGHISFALYAYVYKIFLYPKFGPKYAYKVTNIERADDILEINLSPVGKALPFLPGQFAFVKFQNPAVGREEHPFSLASDNNSADLKLIVKIVGDYTLSLKNLEAGNPATVWGAYGAFGERFFCKNDAVCIAGGIGITPFLSLINHEANHRRHERKIHLLYLTKNTTEAYAAPRLTTLASAFPWISYIQHLSQTQGRLTAQKIQNFVPNLTTCRIFLCGPVPMMTGLTEQFSALGIPRRQIISENFAIK